ncbi:MAG: hypothetical protein LUD55_08115 [Oscillospiraceae bacterium]|nr:hypothetical protein [Oscillospiraceae bacterium]
MTEKENARPSVGALGQADEDYSFDFNAEPLKSQEFLLDILPIGAEHAVPAKSIAQMLGTRPRAITKEIEMLRHSGVPICGNQQGFYKPADTLELREYLQRLHARIETICLTEIVLTMAADMADGQEVL